MSSIRNSNEMTGNSGSSSEYVDSVASNPYVNSTPSVAAAAQAQPPRRQPQNGEQDFRQQQRQVQRLRLNRESKRQKLSKLFDEQQSIKRQIELLQSQLSSTQKDMDEMEKELMKLDDDIDDIDDSLRRQQRQAQPQEPPAARPPPPGGRLDSYTQPSTKASMQQQNPSTRQTPGDEDFPDPQWDQDPYWDEDPQHTEPPISPKSSSRNSGSSILPQLDLLSTTATSMTRSTSDKKRQSVESTTPSYCPTKSQGTDGMGTLDQYFPTAASSSSNRKRSSTDTAATVASTTATMDLTMDDYEDNIDHNNNPSIVDTLSTSSHFPHRASLPPQNDGICRNHVQDDSGDAFSPWSQRQVFDLLRKTFRIQNFRDHQKQIIQSTLQGRDVFVIMRTGGGKSLTYQLPALLEGRIPPESTSSSFGQPYNKVTFVISPLLSLIQDQEDQMNDFMPGSALSFTSGMKGGQSEHAHRWDRIRDPSQGVCLVFVTPEKVHQSGKLKSELQKLYEQNRLGRIVIDECHCSCQWGHDFRPDYAKLGLLKRHFPDVPVLAVTATASEVVRDECINILGMNPRQYVFFRSTANRPNLRYQIRVKEDSSSKNNVMDDMATFIKESHPQGAGIIYAYSKKDADTVAGQLVDRGIVAESYHSEVPKTKKAQIHRSWMRNDTQVVVATIAFGLGINKPDVRFVLHHTLSKTLEAYYQESGRAGRDGQSADCILYFSPKDVPRMIKMIHGEPGEPLFWKMVAYAQCFGNDSLCRAHILNCLGEPNSPNLQQAKADNVDNVDIRDVTNHARTVLQLLELKTTEERLGVTMNMLVKDWRTKPDNAPQCVRDNPPGRDISVSECERIIVALLEGSFMDINVKWNAYDSVVYLVPTKRTEQFLTSDKAKFILRVPKREGEPACKGAAAKAPTKKEGAAKKKAGKASKVAKKRSNSKSRQTNGPAKKTKTKSSTNRKKQPSAIPSQARETKDVIELDDSSDSEKEDNTGGDSAVNERRSSLRKRSGTGASSYKDDDGQMWDDDSENEFDG